MSFSVNPATFQSMKIDTEREQQFFLSQLSTLLTQVTGQFNVLQNQLTTLQSATGLAAILNGSGSLNYSALRISANSLGTVTTNQTINCNSAAIVVVLVTISASITLSLNNLGTGVPVEIVAAATGAFTLKMTATLPNSTAYSAISYFTGGVGTSLITTGWVPTGAASRIFTGITNTPAILQMTFV